MKTISKLALAAVLLGGSSGLVLTAPADAGQRKKKEEAVKTPPLSKEVRESADAAQKALETNDVAAAAPFVATLNASAKEPYERYIAGAVTLRYAAIGKDRPGQRKALEELVGNPHTPPADLGRFNYFLGQFAYDANDLPAATTALQRSAQLGYQNIDTQLLLANIAFKNKQPGQGLGYLKQAIDAEVAAGKKPPEDWYKRAVSAAYTAKSPELATWLQTQLKAYPSAENWRSALVVYRDGATLDNQANLDLMRLMRATKSLAGERDYFEFAASASDRGLPGEAKSVIDEGRAAGKVPAGSRAIGEIYQIASAKVASDRASLAAAARSANASGTGTGAAATANALLGYGDYAQAVELYRAALQKGGVDANVVNTRLGIALAMSGQTDAARTAFAAVTGAPRADIARFWSLWLDLRTA